MATCVCKEGFGSLSLADWLCRHIVSVGYREPTEVQKHCIPPILAGRDCIACAKTGSGKTAAFALPILHKLAEDPYGVFALVLTPARELAFQLCEQFRVFGKHIGVKTAVIVGGVDMVKQSLLLSQKPHVVIATPGRLADHLLSTDTVSLNKIRFLVLDEADRLLESSFSADLETIFTELPLERQTLVFGATITDTMKRLVEVARSDAFTWEAVAEDAAIDGLDQRYVLMPAQVKDCYFLQVLQSLQNSGDRSVIVFTHTCRSCQVYSLLLHHLEYPCVALHSLMSQAQRLASLAKFKSGQVPLLVATDVASRGLDIPKVGSVVNLNVPASSLDYVHRVGRTARAGRQGISVTLVTQFDIGRLQNIEQHIGCKLIEYPVDERAAMKDLRTAGQLKRKIELEVMKQRRGNVARKRRNNMLHRSLH